MKIPLIPFCLLLLLLAAACSEKTEDSREFISLEGEWAFRTDPADEGIGDKWYNTDFEEIITLPGSMAENGLGEEVDVSTVWTGGISDSSWYTDAKYARYREPGNIKIPFWLKPVKHYLGPAWYQRKFDLPADFEGRQYLLHLERCHWESRVYINGQPAGSRNSLATPHEYEITTLLRQGENRIAIRIDNRMIIPVGKNAHSVSDHTQSNWNGITGRIGLEVQPLVSLEEIQVYPDVDQQRARLTLKLNNESGHAFKGELLVSAESLNSSTVHKVEDIRIPVEVSPGSGSMEAEIPMGKDALLWSEFDPALYLLTTKLQDHTGSQVDRRETTFGMRKFRVEGTRFHINDHPLYLRGTLECCIFPKTGYPPADREAWEYLYQRCKDHGLNHVRFHSWCPPKAAFEAADELGIYLQVECSVWPNQGSTLGDGLPVDEFIYEEGDRILKAYGNHPSFCMLAHGNEPGGENQEYYLGKLLEYWKASDDRRVYTSGAGWPAIPENDYHNLPHPRIQLWGAGLTSIINAEAPQTVFDFRQILSQYNAPVVSHEIGQWCVYPDFNEIPRYTGVLKPTNFEIFRETLTENHMGELAEDFHLASGKLQALCYKAEIEAALRTPGFAGFQLLQLHDFPGQGTALVGILDPFFNSKAYITPDAFREFCDTTVLLARLDKRVFVSDDTLKATLEMAHFGSRSMDDAALNCRILGERERVLYETDIPLTSVPVDNNIQVGSIRFPLSGLKAPQKLTLETRIQNTPVVNSWDCWVYPEDPEPLQAETIHITSTLDKEAIRMLDEGGKVLWLPYGSVAPEQGAEVMIGFSSIFWNTAWTANQAPHTLGILCDPDHPVFSEFPTEYHSNWQWWDPVSHSQVMLMDDYPPELKPLIQPIDTWFENRRLALAFEAKTGKGKLLVCSIEMSGDLSRRPVTKQLYHSIIDYMNSESFQPGTAMEIRELKRISGQ